MKYVDVFVKISLDKLMQCINFISILHREYFKSSLHKCSFLLFEINQLGATYGPYVRRWMNTERVADLGQCFVAIDPSCFAPGFEDRLTDMLKFLRNMEPVRIFYISPFLFQVYVHSDLQTVADSTLFYHYNLQNMTMINK